MLDSGMFQALDFVRIELSIPRERGELPSSRWWDCQEWLTAQGAMPLSNILAEYHEMLPQVRCPENHVWWDCFDGEDRFSWYFPAHRKDLAALFKLTWGGKASEMIRCG